MFLYILYLNKIVMVSLSNMLWAQTWDIICKRDSRGVNESMDGWRYAILVLELVIKNLIFHKNPIQKFISQDFMLSISTRKTGESDQFSIS